MQNLKWADPQHDFVVRTYSDSRRVDHFPANLLADGEVPADYVDPRTPQQIYDEEVLASLDQQVLKDAARMVEDFYDALVDQLPQSMKDKHGPLMAERKAKRAARP